MMRKRSKNHRGTSRAIADEASDGWPGGPPKLDRDMTIKSNGFTITWLRSSARPAHYVLLLYSPAEDPVDPDARGPLIALFDNAHGPDEHHHHVYTDGAKQAPTIIPAASPEDAAQRGIRWCHDYVDRAGSAS